MRDAQPNNRSRRIFAMLNNFRLMPRHADRDEFNEFVNRRTSLLNQLTASRDLSASRGRQT